MEKKIFIGVAWPYVNGDLHVGHVGGYLLPADITARFFRLIGREVLMVSGSDCFGTPITVEADKRGVQPREVVDEYHARNIDLFKSLGMSFDLYTKTDTDNHREIVQKFLLAFDEKGLLEVNEQEQYYSASLDRFLPDRYVEGKCPHCGFEGARSDQCDNCGKLLEQNLLNPVSKIDKKPVELKATKHLFIKWQDLQKEIESYFESKKDGWREWVSAETGRWLADGLRERAVTRDLDWGVEIPESIAAKLPGYESKRIYVWFDAVIGYYSASVEWAKKEGRNADEFWKNESDHYYFMGKDNLVFHTIFWPGQLMTYDKELHLPDYPAINQYLNLEGKKFSKSRGVTVDTSEFIEKYSADALRFYLAMIMPEESDSNFAWDDFFHKNNSILVGHIGNYVHRTLSIYRGEKIETGVSSEVLEKVNETFEKSKELLTRSRFRDYVNMIVEFSEFANKQFDNRTPWISKKNDREQFIADSGDLVAMAVALASLMKPLTPKAVERLEGELGLDLSKLWQKTGFGELLTGLNIGEVTAMFLKFDPTLSEEK